MKIVVNGLPLTDTKTPADAASVVDVVRSCFGSDMAIYTIGGGTALNFGPPAKRSGVGLVTTSVNRVIDYPARDMTVTVEAGIRMSELRKLLAGERQRLPVDCPQPEKATLGGVVATNTSGPRRFGNGTMRDYVIGISAVDGHGTAFKAGGRVVKNVAGYDFCKLLTGSAGTLAVLTLVTLKVRPLPEASAFVVAPVQSLEQAEQVLASMVRSQTTPAAIELLIGPTWANDPALGDLRPGAAGFLVAGLEGTEAEVRWMTRILADEWRGVLGSESGASQIRLVIESEIDSLWRRLTEFQATPSGGDRAPPALVLKFSIPPSRLVEMLKLVLAFDPSCAIQAHAGSGIAIVIFSEFPASAISKTLIGSFQPTAQRFGGSCVVLRSANPAELTHQAAWGPLGDSAMLMEEVKRQFDPKGLLNPGRFVYTQ
jgi:glycolate dehydrogenase FAD-binding subunit